MNRLSKSELTELLEASFAFRGEEVLHPRSIVRLVAGAADGLSGVVVDKFAGLAVATIYDDSLLLAPGELLSALQQLPALSVALVRRRMQGEQEANRFEYESSPSFSEDLIIEAEEEVQRFEVRTRVKDDFGVFPDARNARALVRRISAGRRVLNLFSYTCGFGVAARLGGAAEAINVDPNRDYLTWGRRNASLNGVDFHLIPDTAQAYLRRLERRVSAGTHRAPEVVVLDPPAFGVGRGPERLIRNLWPELLRLVAGFSPSDVVLLCNDRYLRSNVDFMKLTSEYFPDYATETLTQHQSVLGQTPGRSDPFYSPPLTIHLERRGRPSVL